ncbi:MAG: metallophosphoesterase family protein [Sulfobacillus sp.]
MITIAHLSDLHYCQEHLAEVDRCMDFAVTETIRRAPDVVVLSGDSTDHRLDLHTPAVYALVSQVARLADRAPVLILHGTASHEPRGTLDVFRKIRGKHPIYVADRIKQVALVSGQWQESEDWTFADVPAGASALFSVLPSVDKGAVAARYGAEHAAHAQGEAIADLMAGWAVANRAARAQGIPTIGVSHGTITGCRTEQGVPMMGLDHEFTTASLFAAECSAFLLGHIHQHQVWNQGGRKIAYAGSIGRLHFGELTDKGFIHWNVTSESAEPEFIVTPAKRLIQLDFEGPPDMEKLAVVARDAGDAHVRIRWAVDEEHRHAVDKKAIEALFAGSEAVKLEAHINPIQRVRGAGISRIDSLPDKLRRWAEITGSDAEPLLARLAQLQAR